MLCSTHGLERGQLSPITSKSSLLFLNDVFLPIWQFKVTVMQIEKTLINDRFTFFKSIQKNSHFNYLYFGIALPLEFAIFFRK